MDREALRAIEKRSRDRTIATGIKHVVDHIIALNRPDVCGLTVPWNLQVITKKQNDAKGNKIHFWPQLELLNEPEQLSIL